MEWNDEIALVDAIRSSARPVGEGGDDLDDLVERVGEARFVRLGEASRVTWTASVERRSSYWAHELAPG